MTIPPGFLSAILENPADDSPRLIAADWLEEHGEPEYAEFIRVQVALPKGKNLRVLKRRQSELFMSLGPDRFAWCPGRGRVGLSWLENEYTHTPNMPFGIISRGFVSAVSLPLSSWLQHGPEIVRRQPVTEVRISDRGPVRASFATGLAWTWLRESARGHIEDAAFLYDEIFGSGSV